MKLYDKTILATFQNVLVNNAYECNMSVYSRYYKKTTNDIYVQDNIINV